MYQDDSAKLMTIKILEGYITKKDRIYKYTMDKLSIVLNKDVGNFHFVFLLDFRKHANK